MEDRTATTINTVNTDDPEVCATACSADNRCAAFSIGTVRWPGQQCKLLSSFYDPIDENQRNSYLKKPVSKGSEVSNPFIVPAGGDCWPNKMHYKSSLNSTPINTLKTICNAPNPPTNALTTLSAPAGTRLEGTNYVLQDGVFYYPPGGGQQLKQLYATQAYCKSDCDDRLDCFGFMLNGDPEREDSTCILIGKNDTMTAHVDSYKTYMKAFRSPPPNDLEKPGMIKMTGATASGEFSMNGANSMNGTSAECETACNANTECGGFVRPATIADNIVGVCTWKSLDQTTPRVVEDIKYPRHPAVLLSEQVIVDNNNNLWRKQPRKTPIIGTDASQTFIPNDWARQVYHIDYSGYDMRPERKPNGSILSTTRGTAEMCAATCTANPNCNAFYRTQGTDDDQSGSCTFVTGANNKDDRWIGINVWDTISWYKK